MLHHSTLLTILTTTVEMLFNPFEAAPGATPVIAKPSRKTDMYVYHYIYTVSTEHPRIYIAYKKRALRFMRLTCTCAYIHPRRYAFALLCWQTLTQKNLFPDITTESVLATMVGTYTSPPYSHIRLPVCTVYTCTCIGA